MIKSGASQAFRAFRDLGIGYRDAGCRSKDDNNKIGILAVPLRAGYKALNCFSYTDVAKER